MHHQISVESIAGIIARHSSGVEFKDHGTSVGISLDLEVGAKREREVALKSLLHHIVKLLDGKRQDHIKASRNDLVVLAGGFTIKSVPATSGIVTTGITMAVSVVIAAINIVVGVAL